METAPATSPLSPDRLELLNQLAVGATPQESAWLSGFFAGLGFAAGSPVASLSSGAAPAAAPGAAALTVLYGSESGNAEKLADEARKAADKAGFRARVASMADTKAADLAKAERLLVIVSTWGEGDPPDAAVSYYEAFMGDAMPQLPGVAYSVCALGDTSYEHFCKIGKDFDARLAELGAVRAHDRVDCDVDYQAAFDGWLKGALAALAPASAGAPAAASAPAAVSAAVATAAVYDKKNPFPAELLERVLLNGTGSAKETLHFEISLEGSGLVYEPGDSLGVYPENRPEDIEAVLAAAGLAANAACDGKTLAEALRTDFDITSLSPAIALKYNAVVGNPELQALLDEEGRVKLKDWSYGRQLVDLLETFPHRNWTPEALVAQLRPLAPRLYSIASSLRKHPGEVHLTVAAVRYEAHGRERVGVCSTYLADRIEKGGRAKVFLHSNKNFRLPGNGDVPVIMVGPGTGIAPFRAFVEERQALGAKGRNWLFFGDQRFSYDFLYQLEWLDYLEDGVLTELSTAFSRDQRHKVYVQDRLRERGAEIWQWLEEGAHFYVCGDASRMAKDVHQALLDLIAEHGKKTPEDAKAYLDALRKGKRYQRDVY